MSNSPSTSPFRWKEYPQPSILAGDKSVENSRAASAKVAKLTKERGRNPGTISGLSRSDRLATLIPKAYGRSNSGVR